MRSATSPVIAVGRHAVVEPPAQGLHALVAALGPHGLAELVGLARREPRGVHGHLHELLLEQGHAQGLAAAPSPAAGAGRWLLQLLAPPDVGVHRPALDGPGPDERHLHHQVVELLRPQAGQGGHLGPGLDLEHADRVGPAQHGVDLVVLGHGGQVDPDPVASPPGRWCRAAPRACPGPAGRTSPGRPPRSRPCPTGAPCAGARSRRRASRRPAPVLAVPQRGLARTCGPTRPGTPRRWAGRR